MTIEITRPELEALIQERLQSGAHTDIEEILLEALKSPVGSTSNRAKKNFAEFLLDSPLRDSGLVFERNKDYPRTPEL